MKTTVSKITVQLLCGVLFSVATYAKTTPNIIYIMVDDLGYSNLGCYGSGLIKTPNIDKMASEGIKFTDAYSGASVCAPARSSLMTGLHMGRTPLRSNSDRGWIEDDVVTLPEVLKKGGYATGGFGKWGLGAPGTPGAAEKQGWDMFFGYYSQIHAHTYYPDYLIENGKEYPLKGNVKVSKLPAPIGGIPTIDAKTGVKREFSHYVILDKMKQWIRKKTKAGEPFFCYAPWTPPHAKFTIPAEDPAWQMYKDNPWSTKEKGYAAFISMIDRQVGEVFQLLEELNITDNTIVFFASDNGKIPAGRLNRKDPFKGYKGDVYEGGLRVPFIASWQGKIQPNQVSNLPLYFPDILPTFAELTGTKKYMPKDIDGISFLPTLLGKPKKQKKHDYMFWCWYKMDWKNIINGVRGFTLYDQRWTALRMGNWKAVQLLPDAPVELYNLTTDIGEKNNIAGKYPDIVEQMSKIMKEVYIPPTDDF